MFSTSVRCLTRSTQSSLTPLYSSRLASSPSPALSSALFSSQWAHLPSISNLFPHGLKAASHATSSRPFTTKKPGDISEIFEGNEKFRQSKLAGNPEYFKNMALGQKPRYLLIGCSDSRVGVQEIMGLDQGNLFVHRNVANLVVNTDLNMLSILQYGVEYLGVEEILVVGHYNCGGVRASLDKDDKGLIENWLNNIRHVARLHDGELSAIPDIEDRARRLVELNVQEQVYNLHKNHIVKAMKAKEGRPRIHGLVYDIAEGRLVDLGVTWKEEE